jgi:glutamate racemase
MIGILDSGIGGTLIEEEIRRLLPGVETLYLKDTEHFPYGGRPPEEVVRIIDEACGRLAGKGARLIVLACNSASVASLGHLRRKYEIPFVGVVPAVKPAAQLSRTKRIAVFGTSLTTHSEALDALIREFCQGVAVSKIAFPELAEMIERGDRERAREIVEATWEPYRSLGIDVVVLGCTHYTLIADDIRNVVGPDVQVIDSNLAVARQVKRVWDEISGEREPGASEGG